jgi:hypothetical protein
MMNELMFYLGLGILTTGIYSLIMFFIMLWKELQS